MTYRVELADRAARDLERFYLEKNASKFQAAAGLCNRREEASPALERYLDRLSGRGGPLVEPQIGEVSRLAPDEGTVTI